MTKTELINRLNEIESEMKENMEAAAESCREEGYPDHGSNYELRVESLNKPLQEEMDELLDEFGNLNPFFNGEEWIIRNPRYEIVEEGGDIFRKGISEFNITDAELLSVREGSRETIEEFDSLEEAVKEFNRKDLLGAEYTEISGGINVRCHSIIENCDDGTIDTIVAPEFISQWLRKADLQEEISPDNQHLVIYDAGKNEYKASTQIEDYDPIEMLDISDYCDDSFDPFAVVKHIEDNPENKEASGILWDLWIDYLDQMKKDI